MYFQRFAICLEKIIFDGAFKGLNARAIVVVNEQGTVQYTELVPEVGQEPDYEKALAAL